MLQRRHRCALGAAFAFAAATFLLGLFFLPLPGGRLSSLTRFGAPLDSGGERPGTLEIVELERGRWKIVFSRIDPEAEGSFKVRQLFMHRYAVVSCVWCMELYRVSSGQPAQFLSHSIKHYADIKIVL